MRTWHMKCPCSPLHGLSTPVPEGGASILLRAMLKDTEQFSLTLFNPSVCIRWEFFSSCSQASGISLCSDRDLREQKKQEIKKFSSTALMQVRMNKQQQCTDRGWDMGLMQNLFLEVVMKPKMDKLTWFAGG